MTGGLGHEAIAGVIALLAAAGAALVARIPLGCKHCPHCQQIKRDQLAEQERLAREYEARVGLRKDDDDGTL